MTDIIRKAKADARGEGLAMSELDAINASLPIRFPHAGPQASAAAVVFDMDGTLAEVSALADRYLASRPKDWHGFHTASEFAPANQWVVDAARECARLGYAVLIVTGRMADYAGPTHRWLVREQVTFDRLYMRASRDFRPDYQVKSEIAKQIEADGFFVVHAYDDNPAVLALWDELGITTTVVPSHLNGGLNG